MTLRIVHAVRSRDFAGVEQHIRRLAIAQSAAGDEVHVIGGDPNRMAGPLLHAGATFAPAGTTFDVLLALRRRGPLADVVNSHMTAADGAAAVACRGRDRPALVSTRHFAQPRARFRPLGKWVDARMDAEIAVSATVAAGAAVRAVVVPSGVDSPPQSDSARRPVVMIAQRLQAEKHTADGIRAFAASGVDAAGWKLIIAGEGVERGRLERLTRDLGIEPAVSFLGFRDDLPELMATSGILLAPCPFEHLGLTVLEAMSAGLPVIATDAGGHSELLHGLDDRTLYPPRDVAAAAAVLRSLAMDPEGRAAIGVAARARQQERYSLSAQVAATRTVYESAIGALRG